MRDFTLAEFADAIEKDGLPQITGVFFIDKVGYRSDDGDKTDLNGPIAAACAIGMAAINLGVDVQSLRDVVKVPFEERPPEFENVDSIAPIVEIWNDDNGLTYEQIASRIRSFFRGSLNRKFSARPETYKTVEL